VFPSGVGPALGVAADSIAAAFGTAADSSGLGIAAAFGTAADSISFDFAEPFTPPDFPETVPAGFGLGFGFRTIPVADFPEAFPRFDFPPGFAVGAKTVFGRTCCVQLEGLHPGS
jgi:hypothetical protein